MSINGQFSESELQLFGALVNNSRADINKLAGVYAQQDGDVDIDNNNQSADFQQSDDAHQHRQEQSNVVDRHGSRTLLDHESGHHYDQRSPHGSRASSRAGSRAGSRAESRAVSRAESRAGSRASSSRAQQLRYGGVEDDENDVPPGIDLTHINDHQQSNAALFADTKPPGPGGGVSLPPTHELPSSFNNRHTTTSSAVRRQYQHEKASRSAASSGRFDRSHHRHHRQEQEDGNNDRHRSHHHRRSSSQHRHHHHHRSSNYSQHRRSGDSNNNFDGGRRQHDKHFSASQILRVEDEEKEMIIRQINNFGDKYSIFLKRPVSRQDTLGACRAALADLKNLKIQEENAAFVFNCVVGGCGLIEWGMVTLGATKMHGWSKCLKYDDKISTNNATNTNLKPIMIELAKRMFPQGEKSNPYFQLAVALARSAHEYWRHGPPAPEAPASNNSGTYVHVNHNTSQPLPTPITTNGPSAGQAPTAGPTVRPLPFARARPPPTAAPNGNGAGGGGMASLVSMIPTLFSMMSGS